MKIVEWTGILTRPIKSAIRRARHEISFLHEYLTRLIADVVTGKLDVREAAGRLPDEQEGELIDEIETETDMEEDVPGNTTEAAEEVESVKMSAHRWISRVHSSIFSADP